MVSGQSDVILLYGVVCPGFAELGFEQSRLSLGRIFGVNMKRSVTLSPITHTKFLLYNYDLIEPDM